ncbi:MAG: peptidoglycan DD-metalloendopeptidase family protein [Thermoleophilia bacterium]|nr:peptidoglycan DD-metalloendopeptidase family protein [Thermoleophilia bacterium]
MPKRKRNAGHAPLAWLIALALASIAFGLSYQAPPASAKSAEEKLDAVEERIGSAQEREGVLTSEIDALGDEISVLEDQVAELRWQEAAAEAELAAKQAELDRAEAELDEALERLETLRGNLRRALNALSERLVAMYTSGSPDLTTLVLTSQDYGDMVANAEYLQAIRESDESLAERVRSLRDETKRLVEVRRESKLTIEAARDAIAAEEQRLERTRATLETREGDLLSARAERENSLESVRGDLDQHEEVAADLRAKVEAQIAAATSGTPLPAGPLPTPSSSGLIWPIDGIFTSPFGPRWGSMHEGIDISAAEGTPIRAAAAGTVILLQSEYESGGYGNYTCIDHGGGLSTCYAHQSGFATSSGASVSQGDLIGYVGNTGHSFGAHLHFEVRINGVATDPLGYL